MQGWLATQPHAPAQHSSPIGGVHALGLADARDTLLYIPATLGLAQPVRLVVLLHGAGGEARQGVALLQSLADASNLILLAPSSRGPTWDVLQRGYGPDVSLLDQALEQLFSRYPIDPAYVAIGGFSDGASYALSLGLANGGLFTHIIAFSPGFIAPTRQQGTPRIYISHGVHDRVLPIERCSRRIVPQLERAGYQIRYHEFDGPHTVPPAIAAEALSWFVAE